MSNGSFWIIVERGSRVKGETRDCLKFDFGDGDSKKKKETYKFSFRYFYLRVLSPNENTDDWFFDWRTLILSFIKFQDFNHNLLKFLINTREINKYIYTWNVIDMTYVKSQYLNEISYNTPRFTPGNLQ